MRNSIKITSFIIDILQSNERLVELLTDDKSGFKVYPIDAKQGTTFPFSVIQRANITPSYCKDGNFKDEVNISILIASPKYNESVDIASLIRDTLEYKSFTDENIKIKLIELVSVSETILENAFIQQLNFKIII